MRKVKFLVDYGEHKKGDIARFSREFAQELMVAGIVTYYFMRKL